MSKYTRRGRRSGIAVVDVSGEVVDIFSGAKNVIGATVGIDGARVMLDGALRDSHGNTKRTEIFTFANMNGKIASLPNGDMQSMVRSFVKDSELGQSECTDSLDLAVELIKQVPPGAVLTLIVQNGHIGWSPSMIRHVHPIMAEVA